MEKNQQNSEERTSENKVPSAPGQESPPDVLLNIPSLKTDEIQLKVDDLKAKVSLSAKLANLIDINIGVSVHVEKVELTIKGLEAELGFTARLERIKKILDRTMDMIDRNPDIMKGALKSMGEGELDEGEQKQ